MTLASVLFPTPIAPQQRQPIPFVQSETDISNNGKLLTCHVKNAWPDRQTFNLYQIIVQKNFTCPLPQSAALCYNPFC